MSMRGQRGAQGKVGTGGGVSRNSRDKVEERGSRKGHWQGSRKEQWKGSREGQWQGSRKGQWEERAVERVEGEPPPRSLDPPCAHPFSGPIHRSWPSWVRVLENLTTIRTRVQSAAPRSCCGRHGWRGRVGRLAQRRRLPSRSGGRTSVPCVSACSSANRLLPAAPAPVHVSIGGAGERAPAD